MFDIPNKSKFYYIQRDKLVCASTLIAQKGGECNPISMSIRPHSIDHHITVHWYCLHRIVSKVKRRHVIGELPFSIHYHVLHRIKLKYVIMISMNSYIVMNSAACYDNAWLSCNSIPQHLSQHWKIAFSKRQNSFLLFSAMTSANSWIILSCPVEC